MRLVYPEKLWSLFRDNAQSAGQQNDDKWRDVEDKLENIMNEIAQLKQQHQDSAGLSIYQGNVRIFLSSMVQCFIVLL